MAMKKKGRLERTGEPRQEANLLYSAHQIWLAGLGALSRAQAGTPKIFDELMREGSKLQGGALEAAQKTVLQAFRGAQRTVNERVETVREQAGETWDNLEKIFQTRVQRALRELGVPSAEDMRDLRQRVDELATSLDRPADARRGARAKRRRARPVSRKGAGK